MEYREFINNLRTAFNKIRSFDKRIEYVRGALPVIGSGTGRIVFSIDDEHVLKLAKNRKGIAQNEVEITIGSYDENKYILANVFDSDDDYTWVVSEKAKKITPKRFKELVGIDIRYIYLGVKNQLSRNQTPIPDDIREILYENEFSSEIHDLCANHSVSVDDLEKISSYGEAIRYGEPSVVVIDYGLNDEIYQEFYNKSKGIYEIFNNFDGNDDILSDMGGEIDIRSGGAAYTSTPEYVQERELKYMQNSSSVKVKDKCLLGHSKEICNKGDINNLIIDVMTESIEPTEADDVVGTIQTLIDNKRDLGFAPFLSRDQISLLNQNGVGLLPIKRNIGIGYILYKNKQKAHELYDYMVTKNGYLTDNTPEEAEFTGNLLGYSDSSINKYIADRYKLAKLSVDTRTPDDFNDLDEKLENEGVGDKYVEKNFGIEPEFSNFNKKYNSMNNSSSEEIVYRDKYVSLIKNPKSLNHIGNNVRGIIDTQGNLYVEDNVSYIHDKILDILRKLNLIKYNSDWNMVLPVNFVTVQRYEDSKLFYLGESNELMLPDNERDFRDGDIRNDMPKYIKSKQIFQQFLHKAKTKNPSIDFINDMLNFENYLDESVINENIFFARKMMKIL